MFGIGKEKEAEKVIEKEEKRGENEIQFDFEEDDKLPFDDDGEEGFADEELGEEPARRALPSRTIILLGLLLLLALGGGGYYYLNSTPALPVQPPAPVTKKVKVKLETPVAPTAPALAPATVKPVTPTSVATPPAQTAPTPAATAPVAPVAPAAVVVAPVGKSAVAPLLVVPATRQPYTLTAGAFLNPKHQRAVEKKIRRLGYTPKVETTYSMVPMTRLLLGVYAPAAAEVRRQELAAQLPELFTLKQGEKVALYAGSYQSLDAARSSADQLYLRGIHVDEETVPLRMPLKKISYGSFPTRAAAEKAAKSAVAAGLTAQVIKR